MREAPVTPALAGLTEEGTRNVELARERIRVSCTPGDASREGVAPLCAPGSTFTAPTTFPEVRTLEDCTENRGKLKRQVSDLPLVSFDVLLTKASQVAIRCTAEGRHGGDPHGSMAPIGHKARWTAVLFHAGNGKLAMQEQLG